MYFRYMDDTFAMFKKEIVCDMFLNQLNSLHPSPAFTHGKKVEGKLLILDVFVEKINTEFITSVCREPTFSVQDNIFVMIHSVLKVEKQFIWHAYSQSPHHLLAFKIIS